MQKEEGEREGNENERKKKRKEGRKKDKREKYTGRLPLPTKGDRCLSIVHTSSVFYSPNFLLVFSTYLLVFVCVIINIALHGAAEPM